MWRHVQMYVTCTCKSRFRKHFDQFQGYLKIHCGEAKHAIGTLPPKLSKMVHYMYKHYCKRCLLIRSVLNIAISALPTGGKLPLLRQEIIVEHLNNGNPEGRHCLQYFVFIPVLFSLIKLKIENKK